VSNCNLAGNKHLTMEYVGNRGAGEETSKNSWKEVGASRAD